MRVVATFHPPSSVGRSIKCNLTPDQEHLVVAKVNRLEVFSLQREGLHHECNLEIWGRIVSLRAIPADGSGRDSLLVLTDHPDPKLIPLSYVVDEAGVPSLVSKEAIDLHDRYARPAEFVTDVLVDPSGQVAVVSCYTGRLKVVQFENGEQKGIPTDISIPELYIVALTFLRTDSETYTLGILHYDHQQRLQLLSRDLDLSNKELSAAPSTILPSTILSSSSFPPTDTPPRLIAVPPYASPDDTEDNDASGHRGGVLVIGGRKILFFEHASHERREIKKEKQRRASTRLSSSNQKEVLKAKEKEKEREARKVKPKAGVKWPWSEVTACCSVDEEGRRFLIGDMYGRLSMLVFDDASSLVLIPLGETSPPVTLTYLTSQVLYLGSHFGESQLLRIHPSPFAELNSETLPIPSGITTVSPSSLTSKGKDRADVNMDAGKESKDGSIISGKGTYVEILDSYENIAPIMDAVMADLDGSGQPQIITCSGGNNNGALKVVRTGADFQEKAIIQGVENATSIWPVRVRFEDTVDTHLVASTLEETHVFSFTAADAIVRLDPSTSGFITNLTTLALKNIPRRVTTNNGGRMTSSYVDSGLVLQATQEKLHLVEYDTTLGLFTPVGEGWDAKREGRSIVAADLNASQFVLGLSGGRLALLNLGENRQFQVLKHRDFSDPVYGALEISAVSCSPFDPTKNYSTTIAVSFWGTNKVAMLSLESAQLYLTTLCESVPLASLPRSLLLHNFGTGRNRKDAEFHPHLLVGMADGTLVSYSFRDKELHDKKIFSLGTTPVSFATCQVDGKSAVFASGSRASVLYWDRQRLHQSAVMLKDMIRGASLNSSVFPSCLVLSTSSALVIGNVRGVDKMQIKTVPLGLDNPRRIAYHPALKVFAVACTRTMPPRIGDFEGKFSSVKILDDGAFNQLGSFTCEPDEEISATLALLDTENHHAPCFCVGTVQFQAEEREPSSGRILLFAFHSDGGPTGLTTPTLRIVASTSVNGCVYQLANVQGMIAAAVNSSVILFRLESINGSQSRLRKVTEWNHNYIVTSLVSKGDTLIVGDAISSISVLKVADAQLNSVARDYAPLWPVAIEAADHEGVIGANSDCNLFSFALQTTGNRAVLERNGSYHIGDVVNKFIHGCLASSDISDDQAVRPTYVFFTSTGRIGVILDMKDEISLQMTALQRNMAKSIVGPGGMNHTHWRAPANSKGHTEAESAFGFLDGDFLEQYLVSSDPSGLLEGESEAERITMPRARVENILEKLQSLH